ncbi:hypothetical protein [Halomontanus rarus]|uniref:hypothetical protein n=1 Tax=Halomontanus rarus TaxID=3034020 RepID=UPI0023E87A32|nr:hypothetical protein [Halovivax sp. TS33]
MVDLLTAEYVTVSGRVRRVECSEWDETVLVAIDCGCETAVYSLTIAVGDTLYRRDEHRSTSAAST